MADLSIGSGLGAYDGTNMGADLASGPEVVRDAPGATPTVEEMIAARGGPAAIVGQMVGESLPSLLAGSPFAPSVDMSGPGDST